MIAPKSAPTTAHEIAHPLLKPLYDVMQSDPTVRKDMR